MKKNIITITLILVLLSVAVLTACGRGDKGDPGAPLAPQSFTATAGDGQVALVWAAPSDDGGAAITKYEVSKDGGDTWITASSDTSHTFTGLTNGTPYTFKVRAVNANGNGTAATASATPKVNADDDPLSGASFKLPANVSIMYESTLNGNAVTSSLFVKVGNNFYCDTRNASNKILTAVYLISNGGLWARWEKPLYEDWYFDVNLNAAEVINELAGSGTNRLLNFMTAAARYTAINGRTKTAASEVAGVMCDEYTIGERTLHHDPVSNLFLQDYDPPAHYRVLLWSTSITGFEDTGALELNPQL